jgi:D-alanine-D-alanine ligase-like ATP-grasp enzyme
MDIQQKRRRNGAEHDPVKDYIRSYDNDWVFAREGVKCPSLVEEVCEMVVHRMGLDFGAVDVGFHSEYGIGIYEVNTAPGIEGQTLGNYANTFKRYLSA